MIVFIENLLTVRSLILSQRALIKRCFVVLYVIIIIAATEADIVCNYLLLR